MIFSSFQNAMRRRETVETIGIYSQTFVLNETESTDDVASSFFYLTDYTSDDNVVIKDSKFASADYDYVLYMHSTLDVSVEARNNSNGETIYVVFDNRMV